IGEREFGLSAAEQLRLLLRNKRPGHGLEHAARGERALGFAGAQLNGREHRLARSLTSIKGRRRNAIDADNTHDLLHWVGLALDISPPWRHGRPSGGDRAYCRRRSHSSSAQIGMAT